jgi:DNA polymerase III subunit alpha
VSNFFHTHAHSHFSCLDAIQTVPDMVARAVQLKQPAMALTDHGNMSGTVQLYQAGKKHGIPVFPGFEGYLVENTANHSAPRYHFGLLATDLDSFRVLAALSSLSHRRENFLRFPRLDLTHLADVAGSGRGVGGVVLLTGCYFGLVQQTLVEKGFRAARRIVEMYASWFPNTFVEIQSHGIVHPDGTTDLDLCDQLVDIASQLGLPVLATQDSHYLDEEDKVAHTTMKKMVYRGGETNEFPGDPFHFASTGWVRQHHRRDHWALSEEGHERLLEMHDLAIPALDTYKPHIPKMSPHPQGTLRGKVYRRMNEFGSHRQYDPRFDRFDRYEDRVEYELDIIGKLGYADYFLHVLDIVQFCRRKKIVVEARGSSNASLVCFFAGITQIDPIQWNLTFERFISLDRQKPPDIDLDVEDSRRGEVVDYICRRYGALSIGNYAALGAREDDGKGSILVTYNGYLRSTMSDALFNKRFGKGIENIADIRRVSKTDYEGVKRLAALEPRKSYGVHAAGLLLNGDDQRIQDYVPTMLVASSNTTVSQYTMDDVEYLGYLKDDILGQRTLRVMHRTQQLMERDDPTDFTWIPYDDAATCKELSEGRPNNGVFQFEGYAMAKGARMLGITNTNDCILAGALFRPACMESGVTDTYIRRRNSRVLRSNIRYPHPAFEKALKRTYGCVLFQEQVLEIMRSLGLDYAGINTFFKIVKDSGKGATDRNLGRAAEVKTQWADICRKNKITDIEAAWHYIEGYVSYGFNAAHSTGYGVRSYRAGYLKTHYPLEYMTAVLESVSGKPKEKIYLQEARRMKIRLLSPDIAVSGISWTMDPKRGAITKGLTSIRGISDAKAEALVSYGPFKDIDDMAERVPARVLTGAASYRKDGSYKGVLKALKDVGALTSFGVSKEDD